MLNLSQVKGQISITWFEAVHYYLFTLFSDIFLMKFEMGASTTCVDLSSSLSQVKGQRSILCEKIHLSISIIKFCGFEVDFASDVVLKFRCSASRDHSSCTRTLYGKSPKNVHQATTYLNILK